MTLSCDRLERALAPAAQTAALFGASSRVSLINDLGHRMTCAGYSSFEKLYDAVNDRCCGTPSIILFLKCTEAYFDPVEKKARLLVGLLRDAHGWEFDGARELGAPVDYHEIRGHLRIGTVVINDSVLNQKVEADCVSGSDDNLIRAAVSTAIETIARYTEDSDPLRIHYVLWKYFRVICRRYEPSCCGQSTLDVDQLDPAFVESFRAGTGWSGCAFSSFCDSFKHGRFPAEYSYGGDYY